MLTYFTTRFFTHWLPTRLLLYANLPTCTLRLVYEFMAIMHVVCAYLD